MNDQAHALYRFFAADETLLYVGITMNPAARWKQHSKDKPWWLEVADIKVEAFPDRQSVLEAERSAIVNEKPVHNVIHNRGNSKGLPEIIELDRLLPVQPGDWVALGLADGRCPVGEVVANDDVFVSVRLKDFWDGGLLPEVAVVRWCDVRRMVSALPEHAKEDEIWGGKVMDDQHLGTFQSAWKRVHLPDGDPVDEAAKAVRRERIADREERDRSRRPIGIIK